MFSNNLYDLIIQRNGIHKKTIYHDFIIAVLFYRKR